MMRYIFSHKTLLPTVIGMVLLFALTHFATTFAFSSVAISYIGANTVHLSYSYTPDPECEDCQADLEVVTNNQVTTLLNLGASAVSGDYQHTGLSPGDYTYHIVKYRLTVNGREVIDTGTPRSVTVDGTQIDGTLLFDESLNGALECSSVIVPDGRSLHVGDAMFNINAPSPCAINVYGQLTIDGGTRMPGVQMNLFSPHSFRDLQQINLVFKNGSAGSSLQHSEQITLTIESDAFTVKDLKHSSISGQGAANFSMNSGKAVAISGRFENAAMINSHALTLTATLAGKWQLSNIESLRIESSTIEAEASLDVSNSSLRTDSVILLGKGSATFTDNIFFGPTVFYTVPATEVTGPLFRNSLRISSPSESLSFDDNDFAGEVRLTARSAAVFTNNRFLAGLVLQDGTSAENSWCQNNGFMPTIEGNSFLGEHALSYSIDDCPISQVPRLAIGANYYGDPQGPVYGRYSDDPEVPGISYNQRWLDRGGIVLPNTFKLEKPLKTGTQWRDKRIFPRFWLNGWRLGQYVIAGQPSSLLRNTESLLTLDLVTSHEQVSGVAVWVEWNGTRVDSTHGPNPILVRDYGARTGAVHRSARSTVNFILPPAGGESANLVLWLDTSGVSGYDDPEQRGELRKLVEIDIPLRAAPGPIGFHVVPITVNGKTPAIGDVLATLHSVTPAMLPITPAQLRISSTSYSPAWDTGYLPISAFTNVATTDLARYRHFMSYNPEDYPEGELMDLVIGVVPKGTLGTVEGVYMNLRRGVTLVDESKPEAVFHELGHAIGLHNLVEQYSWPKYPPNGRPVEGVTLFLNQASTSNLVVNSVFSGDVGRIIHTAAPGQWWYDRNLLVFDVMGNANPFWPHPATLQEFAAGFSQLAAQQRPPAPNAHLSQRTADSERRVVVTMETERFETTERSWFTGERRCVSYRPIAETMQVLPRTLVPGSLPRTNDPPTIVSDGALPLCLDSDAYSDGAGAVEVCLLPLSADGNLIEGYQECRRVLAPAEVNTARTRDMAFFFFDVPSDVNSFSLVTTRSSMSPRLLRAGSALTVQLLAPTSGTTLAETVTLRWNAQLSHADPAQPSDQPVLFQVAYSDDGGANWTPVGMPVEGNTLTLQSKLLPQGRPFSLRVTATDAFLSAHSQVDGLVVPADPPVVKIFSPQPGDQAAPGHGWLLHAAAWEAPNGAGLSGSWHSSLDGFLGTGSLLQDVVLSPGTHQLSYRVTAANGATNSASASVTVAAMSSVDLALHVDDLTLSVPLRDPILTTVPQLRVGLSQTATLRLRNTGIPLTATMQLFVQSPGGAEQLLAEESIWLEPFAIARLGGAYTAGQKGLHRFRGQVTVHTIHDDAPANNQHTWEITAAAPARLAFDTSSLMLSGPAEAPTSRSITLRNSGDQGLIIQHIELKVANEEPGGFSIAHDDCAGQGLAAGEQCRITVAYVPREGIEEQIALAITTTDPEQPVRQITLTGRVGPPAYRIYLPLIEMLR
jgi:hypothetical protein